MHFSTACFTNWILIKYEGTGRVKKKRKEKKGLKLFFREGFKDAVYVASTKESQGNLFPFIITYQKKKYLMAEGILV